MGIVEDLDAKSWEARSCAVTPILMVLLSPLCQHFLLPVDGSRVRSSSAPSSYELASVTLAWSLSRGVLKPRLRVSRRLERREVRPSETRRKEGGGWRQGGDGRFPVHRRALWRRGFLQQHGVPPHRLLHNNAIVAKLSPPYNNISNLDVVGCNTHVTAVERPRRSQEYSSLLFPPIHIIPQSHHSHECIRKAGVDIREVRSTSS